MRNLSFESFKVTLIGLASLLMSYNLNAQDISQPKRLYMEVAGGYGFPLVSDDLGSTNELIGTANRLLRPDSSISIVPVQGTQGPGWQFGFNTGYMFHPNIGVELGFRYLRSNRFLLAKNETPTFQAEHGIIGERIDIIPQLVLQVKIKKKWSLYSKTGLVVPVWGRSMSDIKIDDQEGRLVSDVLGIENPDVHGRVRIKASTFGKFSYGFQNRIGAAYQALDWLSVFGEVSYVALTIRSKEDRFDDVEITLQNVNGGDPFTRTEDDIDEIDKRTVFVNELTESSNNPTVNPNPDPNKPLEELARKDNFNQLAISFGLRFYIK